MIGSYLPSNFLSTHIRLHLRLKLQEYVEMVRSSHETATRAPPTPPRSSLSSDGDEEDEIVYLATVKMDAAPSRDIKKKGVRAVDTQKATSKEELFWVQR